MVEESIAINGGDVNGDRLHPALRLLHTIQGHKSNIRNMAISPDGKILASSSRDTRVCLWALISGQFLYEFHHGLPIRDVAWSPDGTILASSTYNTIYLWNVNTKELLGTLRGDIDEINCIAWSSDGSVLAASSVEGTICQWDMSKKQISRTIKDFIPLNCIAWSPKGDTLAIGSHEIHLIGIDSSERWTSETIFAQPSSNKLDTSFLFDESAINSIREKFKDVNLRDILNITRELSEKGEVELSGFERLSQIENTRFGVKGTPFGEIKFKNLQYITKRTETLCMAWSPDGLSIASGCSDNTIRILDLTTKSQTHVLEAHTDPVVCVSFLDSGRLLASLSKKGTLAIWRVDRWVNIVYMYNVGAIDTITNYKLNITFASTNFAFHPTGPIMALPDVDKGIIKIWHLDLALLRDAEPIVPTIHYVNAKAILLGESAVGKSGLGIRLAEHTFRPTESTHGAQFWHLPVSNVPGLPTNLQAELTLWDLAGQPDYRLVHQLFVDDADAALLLFDCSNPSDPFHGVPYWAKVLRKQASPHTIKFLVSARSDVSPVTVDQLAINRFLDQYRLHKYFKTSAKEDEGVEELFKHLLADIPWQDLPRTSTPQLFQIIRDFILSRKEAGEILINMEVIRQEVETRHTAYRPMQPEIDTVVALLQARGLVYRLDPRPGVIFVLARPELINQYASSIIQAARNHPLGIGAVSERDVLVGTIPFLGFKRLPRDQEVTVLEATVELLIRHDLCFREMGLLVFPSQINVTLPTPKLAHPRTEVSYRFSGSIEAIYATLVVRLSYTDYFHREDLWKYAVEFSRCNDRLGFSMLQIEEETGELEVYFHPNINEFDRVTFIRFITDHLRNKGIDIQEEIRLYCPKCGKEIDNRDAIETRVKEGFLDIPCQYCATTVLIPRSIEERYRHDNMLVQKQRELAKNVGQRTEKEIEEFKSDKQQYSQEEDHRIHILHLSDIHLENKSQAQVYRMQLVTDLVKELKVKRLEYLVISGDIANHANEDEYRAAFELLDTVVKHFGLDANRIVIVPGNHDLNWGVSKKAYPFFYKEDLPTPLREGRYIPAGDTGVLLRDEELYQQRFVNFNVEFYKRAYGNEYPLDYTQQAILVERPEDSIILLELNSCWQIDHQFRDRACVNMEALAKALDNFQDEKYDGWLKIAVWHHPVTGKMMMNDEFMQLLAVHGFQVCMHGHIHEATEGYHKYDDKRGIHIIGAGTFGAPANEQATGIPLQYNLITFDPATSEVIVNTRRKEKSDGAWMADARWGNKDEPKPYYSFRIQNYHPGK